MEGGPPDLPEGRAGVRALFATFGEITQTWHVDDVIAEGDLDFRGTLGVAKDAPVGFEEIRLRFEVDTDAPQDKLDLLLKLTERYCVVYQTIKNGPKVSVTMKRV